MAAADMWLYFQDQMEKAVRQYETPHGHNYKETAIFGKMIRTVQAEDAQAITAIYNGYVTGSTITFEEEPVTVDEMAARIAGISSEYPFFIYEEGGEVKGYCYAHTWKGRSSYRYTAETTIYLSPDASGKGVGKALMHRLISECRSVGLKALIACITDGNTASITMHEKLGFRKVSHFEKVGFKFGQWLDVVDYELVLS